MSIATGFRNAPPCLRCLTLLLKVDLDRFRDSLLEYIRSRECYLEAWNWACRDAGMPEEVSAAAFGSDSNSNMTDFNEDDIADSWDAGDMGCGDLVLELRLRLNSLEPGEIFKLYARDPGAREDLPAWCRLTGHTLLCAEHPNYWIKRKE